MTFICIYSVHVYLILKGAFSQIVTDDKKKEIIKVNSMVKLMEMNN